MIQITRNCISGFKKKSVNSAWAINCSQYFDEFWMMLRYYQCNAMFASFSRWLRHSPYYYPDLFNFKINDKEFRQIITELFLRFSFGKLIQGSPSYLSKQRSMKPSPKSWGGLAKGFFLCPHWQSTL